MSPDPTPVVIPRPQTLKRYGLDEAGWLEIFRRQGRVCYVCQKPSRTGRYNTDHDHVRGWRQMPAEVRRLHVRGILCHFCNHYYVGRCITIQKAERVAEYLRQHAARLESATCLFPPDSRLRSDPPHEPPRRKRRKGRTTGDQGSRRG